MVQKSFSRKSPLGIYLQGPEVTESTAKITKTPSFEKLTMCNPGSWIEELCLSARLNLIGPTSVHTELDISSSHKKKIIR